MFPTSRKHEIVNSHTGEVVDTVDSRDAAFRRQDWLTMTTDGTYHVRVAQEETR